MVYIAHQEIETRTVAISYTAPSMETVLTKGHYQANIEAKDPWAMGRNRGKWKERQGVVRNLHKIYKKDQRSLAKRLVPWQYRGERKKSVSKYSCTSEKYQDLTLRGCSCRARNENLPSKCWQNVEHIAGKETGRGRRTEWQWPLEDKLGGDASPAKIC